MAFDEPCVRCEARIDGEVIHGGYAGDTCLCVPCLCIEVEQLRLNVVSQLRRLGNAAQALHSALGYAAMDTTQTLEFLVLEMCADHAKKTKLLQRVDEYLDKLKEANAERKVMFNQVLSEAELMKQCVEINKKMGEDELVEQRMAAPTVDYQTFTTKDMPKAERRALDVGHLWSNSVRCLACGETIRSRNRHDFVWCSCENVAVDGGSWYLKRVGGTKGYEELSEVYNDILED